MDKEDGISILGLIIIIAVLVIISAISIYFAANSTDLKEKEEVVNTVNVENSNDNSIWVISQYNTIFL